MSTQYVMTLPTGVDEFNYPVQDGDTVAVFDQEGEFARGTVVNVMHLVEVRFPDGKVEMYNRDQLAMRERPGLVAGFGKVADGEAAEADAE